MQTLTKMDNVVIDDMIIMDDMNHIKLTHLLPFSQNLRVPFCTIAFTSKESIAYLNLCALAK